MIQNNVLTLNFVKKDHKRFKNILIYKVKQLMLAKNLKTGSHVLEDGASGCASGDIKQVIVKFLFRI